MGGLTPVLGLSQGRGDNHEDDEKMTKDDGGPAYPTHAGADWGKDPLDPTKDDPRNQILGGGMSLRDWFAGQALAWAGHDNWTSSDPRLLAERAYQMADAMLAARGKP